MKKNNLKKDDKSNNKKWKFIIPILLIFLFIGYLSLSSIYSKKQNDGIALALTNELNTNLDQDSLLLSDTNFIKAATIENDSIEEDIKVSDPNDTLGVMDIASNISAEATTDADSKSSSSNSKNTKIESSVDNQAGKRSKRVYDGKRINISIIGLDNRIGTNSNHADANHILSILPDNGIIEITSIPRDTPADARMPDTSGQNKLTIVRANRGRKAYMREAARIARLDKIDYYVEFGFSQAMGILELLGFKDRKATLQVLRSRKGLGGDDYQRSYNQGQFIKQILLKHFSKVTGTIGDILIHGALTFVETNLDFATVKDIVNQLEKNGFADNSSDVILKVRPALGMKFNQYDLTNKETLNKLKAKIEGYNKWSGESKSKNRNVSNILWTAIKSAEKDTLKNPKSSINKLRKYFDQKAWMQIDDIDDRNSIREHLGRVLSTAYFKRNDGTNARKVIDAIQKEKEMFDISN